jgi:hypothetical protein
MTRGYMGLYSPYNYSHRQDLRPMGNPSFGPLPSTRSQLLGLPGPWNHPRSFVFRGAPGGQLPDGRLWGYQGVTNVVDWGPQGMIVRMHD